MSWGRCLGVGSLSDGVKESLPVACDVLARERWDAFLDTMMFDMFDVSLVGIS